MIYNYYNKENIPELVFEIESSEYSVDIVCYEVVSWSNDLKEVSEKQSLFDIMVKWNGCSHLHL
jgi:hypothetical protein